MRIKRVWMVVVFLVIVAAMLTGPVMARPALFDSPLPPPEPVLPPVDLGGIERWLASIGVGGLVLLVAELLKRFKILPDGSVGLFATVCNVFVFAGLVIAGAFGFDVTVGGAQSVIEILKAIGQLVVMIVSSPVAFGVLRDANVLRPLPGRQAGR